MPAFLLKQRPFKAGKSEFSQYTARQVTAAIHEAKSKHRSQSTSSPRNSYPYLTAKGIWHAQGEAEALGLQCCGLQLYSSLSRPGRHKPRAPGSPQGKKPPPTVLRAARRRTAAPACSACSTTPGSAGHKAKMELEIA